MKDSSHEQDKIRQKRLAKLEREQQQERPLVYEQRQQRKEAEQHNKECVMPSLELKSGHRSPTADSPTALTSATGIPLSSNPSSVSTAIATSTIETFEDWQDKTIARVLQITLDPGRAEASNWRLTYLKDVAENLRADSLGYAESPKLDSEWIDHYLLARLSLSPSIMTDDPLLVTVVAALPDNETAFEYLSSSWKRERSERRKLESQQTIAGDEMRRRVSVLNQLKDLLVSYIGLVLIDPTMFPQEHITSKPLGALELEASLLPAEPTSGSRGLQPIDIYALLQNLANRFASSSEDKEDGGLEDIIGPLVTHLGSRIVLSKVDIGNSTSGYGTNWRETLKAIEQLSELKAVASTLPLCSNWDVTTHPQAKAASIEIASVLGPFLRLSSFPDSFPSIAKVYFPEPSTQGRGDLDSAAQSLRGTLDSVQSLLFRIMNNIVRAGAGARESVLQYLGHVAVVNAKRSAMRVDPRTVSSHGFIINLHSILLKFAEPFMNPPFSKINKIEATYYKQSQRIDVRHETKMHATQSESDEYYSVQAREHGKPLNFITEVFFLCCTYFRLGTMHAIKDHKGYQQQIRHLGRELADLESNQSFRGTPHEAQALAAIQQHKQRLEMFKGHLEAYQVDPTRQHPHIRVTLPMPDSAPVDFRMLPEFLIEDITEFLSFVSKAVPHVLAEGCLDELVTFMLVFLTTPYMKNPYLKGQFVEIMFFLTRPMSRFPNGCLGDVLNLNPMALKHLMPSLIHAYIQIEITGSHTQFYDKFNTRYYITQLFKLLWLNPSHREALRLESRNLDVYVRFANLLMNDTTYLLDDALSHLARIAEIQKQMENSAAWEDLPSEERQEQEKLLRQYEGQVRGDLDLGSESLRLLKLFAGETQEPFLTPEIVDRLAAMLDMNLSMLAGPRCQELKVREPDALHFKPKELLSEVLAIFIELGPKDQFQQAIAKDGRSYSKDLFERAIRIARKTAMKTDQELEGIAELVVKVEAIKAADDEDDAMGEVPDEFLDPLTYEIMRDPVRLPSSKTIVDRSTIKQHYLSDATDPFNRVPLKWEDIEDAVEIRDQIQAFLKDRASKRLGIQK